MQQNPAKCSVTLGREDIQQVRQVLVANVNSRECIA